MANNTTFTPAATTTISPDIVAASYPIPAVDAGNQDLMLVATFAPCWISFGPGAVVGPGLSGVTQVQPGYPVLMTSAAATIAATVTNPSVVSGVPAVTAAGATVASVMTQQRGATLSVTRGTASARSVF